MSQHFAIVSQAFRKPHLRYREQREILRIHRAIQRGNATAVQYSQEVCGVATPLLLGTAPEPQLHLLGAIQRHPVLQIAVVFRPDQRLVLQRSRERDTSQIRGLQPPGGLDRHPRPIRRREQQLADGPGGVPGWQDPLWRTGHL
jgi:hypothetical protein